jgi:hypothetical protein
MKDVQKETTFKSMFHDILTSIPVSIYGQAIMTNYLASFTAKAFMVSEMPSFISAGLMSIRVAAPIIINSYAVSAIFSDECNESDKICVEKGSMAHVAFAGVSRASFGALSTKFIYSTVPEMGFNFITKDIVIDYGRRIENGHIIKNSFMGAVHGINGVLGIQEEYSIFTEMLDNSLKMPIANLLNVAAIAVDGCNTALTIIYSEAIYNNFVSIIQKPEIEKLPMPKMVEEGLGLLSQNIELTKQDKFGIFSKDVFNIIYKHFVSIMPKPEIEKLPMPKMVEEGLGLLSQNIEPIKQDNLGDDIGIYSKEEL